MELQKLRELIEKMKAIKSNPACLQLAERFESFLDLHEQPKNEDYFEQFGVRLKQFWDAFDQAAESLGASPDLLKENLQNPDYFAAEQWDAMQTVREEFSEKPTKLGTNNNKRMRI